MTFHPLMIAHAILPRTLSCLFVKRHHRCSCRKHAEIQVFSMVPWVASIEASLAVIWSVSPIHERLCIAKHILKIYISIGTVSYSAAKLSVPVGFSTLCALKECTGVLPSCFVPLGFPPTQQWPCFDWLQCTAHFGNLVSSEFSVLYRQHRSNLLNQLENLFWTWSKRFVPFPFHLFRREPSTNWLMIPDTDFPVAGLPAVGSSFFQMQPPHLTAHVFQSRRLLYRSAVRWPFVSSVPEHAHATVLNTVRCNIDQLVWESYHKCVVPFQECSTIVEVHHSYHMQVSSILQMYMVDGLLLVAVGTQHHDSHHKTVLEEWLFWDQCGKDPNFCQLPSGSSSEIQVY